MKIRFEEGLELPDNFSEIVKERNGKDDAVLEFTMVDNYDEPNSNLMEWSLVSADNKELVILLYFESPLLVSQVDGSD